MDLVGTQWARSGHAAGSRGAVLGPPMSFCKAIQDVNWDTEITICMAFHPLFICILRLGHGGGTRGRWWRQLAYWPNREVLRVWPNPVILPAEGLWHCVIAVLTLLNVKYFSPFGGKGYGHIPKTHNIPLAKCRTSRDLTLVERLPLSRVPRGRTCPYQINKTPS